MPLFNRLARIATSPLPRMISPRGHAIFDYVTAGAFFAIAGLFWPRNKRAAIASLLCGSAEMAVNLITDYDGDRKKVISLRARRQIDLGLAAMTATMPDFLAFKEEPEKRFFLAQGAIITAASELTQVPSRPHLLEKRSRRDRAA